MAWQDLGQIIPDIEYINIEASNYNPNIDSDITITVTATDQDGNPISNQSYTLKENGETLDTLTTNSNGVATYIYTCSDWGLYNFSVNTSNCQILVDGWKTVQTATKFTAKSNGRMVSVRCSQESNTGTTGTEYDIGTLISGYRPKNNITVPLESIASNGNNYGYIRCYTDGSIKLKTSMSTYSSSGGITLYGTIEFSI